VCPFYACSGFVCWSEGFVNVYYFRDFISLIVLGAVGILGWGFYRANFWQTGNLSLVTIGGVDNSLAVIFLGCLLLVYINIVGILFLVASAGLYIWLGNRLRAAGQDAVLRGRATEGSQIPPSQQVKQKIHGKRQLIQQSQPNRR